MPRGRKSKQERAEKTKRDWLKLPSDVTRNILYRVGVIDILENAQKVCTEWRKICKDPSMWRVIYMTNFWDPNARPPLQDMCKHAVDRSQGKLVDLTIVDFGNDDLLLHVADRASNLRRLEAAWCYEDIYNDWSDALKKFAFLEELSLYETGISEEAIETAGRYCPMLRTLKVNQRAITYSGEGCEERAIAIGKNLPELRYLELIGDCMSDIGLKAILDGCHHLESLDLRDCLNIDLKGDMVKRCSQQIKYLKVSNDSDEPYVYENDSRFGATIEPRIHTPDEESYNGSSDDDDCYDDDVYDDECYDDDDYDDDDDDGYEDDDADSEFDVEIPIALVQEVNNRLKNSLYGYFIGKRLAFPVVELFVRNTWGKYGIQKVTMNAEGFFFFKFSTLQGVESILQDGPWMIRSTPIFLNKWTPSVILTKEEMSKVPAWVKMHDVPLVAYTSDGLSLIATKIGKPMMLDSYTSTMCLESWGRCSYARALIEIDASNEMIESLVVAIPKLEESGYTKETIHIEYEWKPPRCGTCLIYGHSFDSCPKAVKEGTASVQIDADDGFRVVKKGAKSGNYKV